MAGGFDEKAGGGGAQMGVMQGPMVSKSRDAFFHLFNNLFVLFYSDLIGICDGETERIFISIKETSDEFLKYLEQLVRSLSVAGQFWCLSFDVY